MRRWCLQSMRPRVPCAPSPIPHASTAISDVPSPLDSQCGIFCGDVLGPKSALVIHTGHICQLWPFWFANIYTYPRCLYSLPTLISPFPLSSSSSRPSSLPLSLYLRLLKREGGRKKSTLRQRRRNQTGAMGSRRLRPRQRYTGGTPHMSHDTTGARRGRKSCPCSRNRGAGTGPYPHCQRCPHEP